MNKQEQIYDLANFAFLSAKARANDPTVSNYALAKAYVEAKRLSKRHRRICENDCNTGNDTDTSRIEAKYKKLALMFGARDIAVQGDPRGATLRMLFSVFNESTEEVFT